MLGIDLGIIQHHLCVNLEAKNFKQKRRSFSVEKCTAIIEEINRFLAVEFISEACYLD